MVQNKHTHTFFDFGGDRRSIRRRRHRQANLALSFFCYQRPARHVDWHTLRYGPPAVFNGSNMVCVGFKNTPVTKYFLTSIIASSTVTSLLTLKPYTHIQIVPHLLHQWQWWRIPVWMASYSNAGEVLFACLAVYNLRALERLFGSRKYAVRSPRIQV